jgi:iron only hydrogenase large subunit-like protein/nitrogen-specific signal transduction histidine kinase
VKAIKIMNGQAEVLSERCIGCGNCVNVCSQQAKVYLDLRNEVEYLLHDKSRKTVAILAPSFPAEFTEIEDHRVLVGMIRSLGFSHVMDVAFGADLVAAKYRHILDESEDKHYISSDCPAIVFYVEHYHPNLIDNLAPIVSPMVATSRLARKIYGNNIRIVFIGPCIAKKAESDEVDEALTFRELRSLFDRYSIRSEKVRPSDFDGPASGMGAIFPLTRGQLQTVNKSDSIIEGKVIVDSGKNNFREAIREFERGEIADFHLELLCCNGCIMGPGMSDKNRHFAKRTSIRKYVHAKLQNLDTPEWVRNMATHSDIDLSQHFEARDRRVPASDNRDIEDILAKMGKTKPSDQLNCGACGYDSCLDHAIAVKNGYAEDEMCLPYTIEKLHKYIAELNLSNEKLLNTRLALKQSEKLANMGQISAGIAHELNNPLGVITMYSNILLEELDKNDVKAKDVELIVEQAARCKNIVSGLLNFARKNKIKAKEVNIIDFINHTLDSVVIPSSVKTTVISDLTDPFVMIDEDQMLQAFTNIEKNAVEAMPHGGELTLRAEGNDKTVIIRIADTGMGVPEENMEKLFTPFFTTKEIGKGTGLGLPLVYGIIKVHNGKISVRSNCDARKGKTGTEFTITLPRII